MRASRVAFFYGVKSCKLVTIKKIKCQTIPHIKQSSSLNATNTSSTILEDFPSQIKSELPLQSQVETLQPKMQKQSEIESSTSLTITVPVEAFRPNEWAMQIWNHPARFKQICWHRRARKTTLAINKLIKEAVLNENKVYAYIAPTYTQAKAIVWRDPMMLKQYLPRELLKKDPNESELYCEFDSGSILQVRGADDPDSLRGTGYAGVIFDEWAMMKPEIYEEIIAPVLRANNGWAWFLFTPKGRNHAYHYWQRSKQWGDWARFFLTADTSEIISRAELEQMKLEMPEDLYRQEMLCQFLEGAGSVFKGIQNCISGELTAPKPGHRYVLGADLARTVDFTVLIVIDQNTNQVVAFERFNDISWSLQKEKISALAKKYNDALVVVDSSGVGDPICEDLQRLNLKVEGFKFTSTSKQELVERLILAISQRIVYFPAVRELLDELESYTYVITPNGNFRYSAPEGQHDDCVMALGLAIWGLHGNLYKVNDGVSDGALRSLTSFMSKPLFKF